MFSTTALLLASLIPTTPVGEGQGTAKPGSTLAQLNAGTHLLGPKFRASDQLGRIVVVEIGGS